MRLTSIEIKGFKSFGDRTVIHFGKGTTSIVGPNGSGKSNVVDALRWVLGEQKTRMLRSEKMENIIFNGTRNRKPANLAEVSLSFENTRNVLPVEYATVTITRKLYRDGESEYFLNGIQCRLKDITDLFMDTGIGPDSYSIIELKMVDEILNDRNNTIKMLLEEAAGITKYKLRKRQTMSRLDETEADLNRVNDLLAEIEKSMKQLEAQARRVDRFNRLREKYRDLSIQAGIRSLGAYRETHERLAQKEQLIRDDKIGLNAKVAALEATLEKMKLDSVEKEKALAAAQKQHNEKLLVLSRLENDIRSAEEKAAFIREKLVALDNQDVKDAALLEELESGIEAMNAEKTAEQARHDLAVVRMAELKEETQACKDSYESVLQQVTGLAARLSGVRQQLSDLETRRAVNETKAAALSDELSRVEAQAQSNEQRIAELDSELDERLPRQREAADTVTSLRQKLDILQERVRAEEANGQQLNAAIAEASRKADASTNEYELTRNLAEQMEGYPDSIRFLRKPGGAYGHLPLLSEIVTCDDRFKVAIENFLDPLLNHFVADSRRDAWNALQLLRNEGQGRASFFLLDALPEPSSSPADVPDGCTRATDAITCDARYRPLFDELLGHVFIASDEASADAEWTGHRKFIVLSPEGNFLRQQYVLSGGSVGRFDGKRTGQARNLEQLQEKAGRFRQEVVRLEADLANNRQLIAELNTEIRHLEQDIGGRQAGLQELMAAVAAAETNKNVLASTNASLARNMDNLRHQLTQLEQGVSIEAVQADNLQRLRTELEDLTRQHDERQAECTALQEQYNGKSGAVNEQQIVLLQLQNKIQNFTRETGFKSAQIQDTVRNREERKTEHASLEAQLAEGESRLSADREKHRSLLQDKQAFEKSLNEQEDDHYRFKGEIDKEEKTIADLRRQREQTDVILQEIHDEQNTVRLRINSVNERLSVEFNIPAEQLEQTVTDETVPLEELRQQVEKMRLQIEQFGAINPLALESFNEVKERFDFITREKEDLAQARQSLMQTIAEIEETAREKYLEAFELIRNNFISVFRSLFSEEDDCNLLLLDPANPLESDVHIMAKPKGKKPLSIHQLSGGEKTLTATALLFGIYLLKPSPFCVLDEVDAPLDDANIDKFNRIIRKFSENSQFVIITHNKRTMSATDIMYGVTMAEMGVTQVVPVDLKEFAEA